MRRSRWIKPRHSWRRPCAKCTLFANNGSLQAQIQLRQADVAKAQNEVARAQDDVKRRAPLVATGAVGQEEFNHSTAQLTSARSALVAAQSALERGTRAVGGEPVVD